ncbi:butyrophilin subfamily 1 member A1-like isoform X2 [Aphelocoma coerulescens]|uniref:butyrophilin subfamily 1 member A1-like isoform X2 n=1 Tax=Aphelocoma coerulescens TaxID=39617 RepID=UPI003604354C
MQSFTQRDLQLLRTELENKLGRTVESNTRTMESMWKEDLQEVFQNIQTLQQAFQKMQDSTQRDLELLRRDLENERGAVCPCALPPVSVTWIQLALLLLLLLLTLAAGAILVIRGRQHHIPWISSRSKEKTPSCAGRTVESNTRTMESMWKEDLQEVFQNIQTLQQAFQKMQDSTQRDLELLRRDLENEREFFKVLHYEGDVTLDADTAHPRLEISADGKSVKDTGVIRHVPSNEKRFDSHLFVLAKEGYTSGKHCWEVSVGRRRSWALGIARESVTRKGPLTLCPQNGFLAIGLADGRDYWAYTDRLTRLSVSGHLHKIGIFLNISAKKLRFYNAHKGATLYTFSIGDGNSQEGKFIPFLSTGPATAKLDPEPLLIVQEFDDDD